MLLAGVVAALAAYAALRDDSAYYLAATAARELPAGATLSEDAVAFTELRVGAAHYSRGVFLHFPH